MNIITSIDVTKIPRDKILVKKNQKGDPIAGKWVDLVLIPTPNSQYGNDYLVAVSVTPEERKAGIKGAILGNAKILKPKQAARPARHDDDEPGF